LPIDEILDEVKKQDAVSSAAHPFSLVDALRDDSKKCDLIEVFNSNNIDLISNAKSAQFAEDNNLVGVAGSDSHVLSSLGRCLNEIESENTLDAVLHSMKHKKIRISKTGYTQQNETMEHLRYKIINSKDYIQDYLNEHYSNSKWLFLLFHKLFEMNPNSVLWTLFYKIAVLALKRISQKVNVKNYDMSFMNERQLSSIIKMAI